MLHQVELGSADPVQLNGRGYTMDDADWSSRAQPVGQLLTSQSHTLMRMLTKQFSTDWQ